jgi:glucose/arabinose dehydrogenase
MKIWTLLLASFMAFNTHASNTTVKSNLLNIQQVAQFDGTPWGITVITNQEAIITIKQGRAYRVNLITGMQHALQGLPEVDSRGQGGLLDVAKSPHFAEQPWLYFTYSKPSSAGSSTTLARAKLDKNTLAEWQDLLVSDSASPYGHHYGSRIAFDNSGHVFFSVGDRGIRENAQNLTNHAGTIIRLNLDGSVPASNPFVTHANIRNEIWSYGHRNPQGLFFDKSTSTLWSNEHGPKGGDEINLIRPGANYGWPIVSYGKEYADSSSIGEGSEKDGIDNPAKIFIPSIAPSSLIRYQGILFSNWNGDFLSTALALRHLNKVKIASNGKTTETRYLEDLDERLRSMAQDSKGALYIGTDSGKLLKVTLTTNASLLEE